MVIGDRTYKVARIGNKLWPLDSTSCVCGRIVRNTVKNKDLIGLIVGALVSKLIDRIFGGKQDGK